MGIPNSLVATIPSACNTCLVISLVCIVLWVPVPPRAALFPFLEKELCWVQLGCLPLRGFESHLGQLFFQKKSFPTGVVELFVVHLPCVAVSTHWSKALGINKTQSRLLLHTKLYTACHIKSKL